MWRNVTTDGSNPTLGAASTPKEPGARSSMSLPLRYSPPVAKDAAQRGQPPLPVARPRPAAWTKVEEYARPAFAQVQTRLVVAGRPTQWGWLLAGTTIVLAVALLIPVVMFAAVDVAAASSVSAAPVVQASRVLDKDGNVIGILRGEQNREDIPLDKVSRYLRDAVVATEDRTFYEHDGVSYRGMLRALWANVVSGRVAEGGSTITQQYARSAYVEEVGTSRSMSRKAKEIDAAKKIEERLTKDEILELYLNNAFFGRRAYGVEAASQTYFKKKALDLTLGQSAYLAGVLRAPRRFQVEDNPGAVVQIRNEVLSDMERAGFIDGAAARKARAEDIVNEFRFGPGEFDTARAGFFIEHVRRLLQTPEFGYTKAEVTTGGMVIHTTLDPKMQAAAEASVSSTLNLEGDPEAALVAMDTRGNVRAMVGGRDVADPARARGHNFAANSRPDDGSGRQAGSAFKPFALAALIENGGSIRSTFSGPSQTTIGSPRCRNGDGTPWKVSNFGGAGFGTLDVAGATINSVNTVYAQIMNKLVSPDDFIKLAGKAGIAIPESDKGCALTLGTTPVTPLEMARGFTTFAAGGASPEPIVISRVESPTGEILKEIEPSSRPAMAEATAHQVTSVLQGVIQRGTGTGAKTGFSAAGKTGTTQNHADAWFAGYTPDLTAVVWVGFPPDSSGKIPLMTNVHGRRVTGGSFPATIWAGFMTKALEGTNPAKFAAPAGEPAVVRPKRRPPTPVAPEPSMLEAPAPELPSQIVPEVPFVDLPVPGI